MPDWRRIRPGWYLLALVSVYALLITVLWLRQGSGQRLPAAESPAPQTASAPERGSAPPENRGLWFPIPGAKVPENSAHLPNALRPYRQGVSEGFDFYHGDSGVPVPFGAAVTAAADGVLVRVDKSYVEPEPEEWQRLMESVGEGASEEELDRLRGRQVWLETDQGRLLRYAHLSAIPEDIEVEQRVRRGEVVGFVGNSGTDEGVAGTRQGARLHFEVWEGDSFFGEGMEPEEIRIAAASLFTGP